MTQPRYEFWQTITPVLGDLIPKGVQFRAKDGGWFETYSDERWVGWPADYEWRAHVEVIPLDVAVEAIACNAEYHNSSESWVVDVDGTRCCGGNLVALHDSIAEALRKAAK